MSVVAGCTSKVGCDATGGSCALNSDKSACAVASGDCVFTPAGQNPTATSYAPDAAPSDAAVTDIVTTAKITGSPTGLVVASKAYALVNAGGRRRLDTGRRRLDAESDAVAFRDNAMQTAEELYNPVTTAVADSSTFINIAESNIAGDGLGLTDTEVTRSKNLINLVLSSAEGRCSGTTDADGAPCTLSGAGTHSAACAVATGDCTYTYTGYGAESTEATLVNAFLGAAARLVDVTDGPLNDACLTASAHFDFATQMLTRAAKVVLHDVDAAVDTATLEPQPVVQHYPAGTPTGNAVVMRQARFESSGFQAVDGESMGFTSFVVTESDRADATTSVANLVNVVQLEWPRGTTATTIEGLCSTRRRLDAHTAEDRGLSSQLSISTTNAETGEPISMDRIDVVVSLAFEHSEHTGMACRDSTTGGLSASASTAETSGACTGANSVWSKRLAALGPTDRRLTFAVCMVKTSVSGPWVEASVTATAVDTTADTCTCQIDTSAMSGTVWVKVVDRPLSQCLANFFQSVLPTAVSDRQCTDMTESQCPFAKELAGRADDGSYTDLSVGGVSKTSAVVLTGNHWDGATAPVCSGGLDAAGTACALNPVKTACAVNSGTCVFVDRRCTTAAETEGDCRVSTTDDLWIEKDMSTVSIVVSPCRCVVNSFSFLSLSLSFAAVLQC